MMDHDELVRHQQRFGQWLWVVKNWLTWLETQVPLLEHCEENLEAFEQGMTAREYALKLHDQYGKE